MSKLIQPQLLTAAVLALVGCRSTAETDEAASRAAFATPYVVVLGTAQDGGYPQIACEQPLCRAARSDPTRGRYVTSLLLVDPRSGRRWLFDASPDLPEQIELARALAAPHAELAGAPGRPPLFDGIFLTHAHIGHYAGLLQLGREAYGTEETQLHATPSLGEYLRTNGPWSLLFDEGRLAHVPLPPGASVELAEDLRVHAIAVPHRHEFSDTVAFWIEGPERSLLYLPDIDKWERWETPIEEWIARTDIALLDASFFDGDELPGRDMSQIPHPFVVESLERFAPLPAEQRAKVHFTHLNHSNPAVDPASPQARRVHEAGMTVAREGDIHRL